MLGRPFSASEGTLELMGEGGQEGCLSTPPGDLLAVAMMDGGNNMPTPRGRDCFVAPIDKTLAYCSLNNGVCVLEWWPLFLKGPSLDLVYQTRGEVITPNFKFLRLDLTTAGHLALF